MGRTQRVGSRAVPFFDVDLGTIEILPLTDAFATDTVIATVTAIHAKSALRDDAAVSA